MLFKMEKNAPKQDPTKAQLSAAITKLRSYGSSSFASLTDEHGNYLQVAGGGLTCMLEKRGAASGQHFRAHLETPNGIHPDGTILAFSGGQVKLQAGERITSTLVIEAFTAFLQGHELPQVVRWRDISSLLGS